VDPFLCIIQYLDYVSAYYWATDGNGKRDIFVLSIRSLSGLERRVIIWIQASPHLFPLTVYHQGEAGSRIIFHAEIWNECLKEDTGTMELPSLMSLPVKTLCEKSWRRTMGEERRQWD
jgi:hypothetical protein